MHRETQIMVSRRISPDRYTASSFVLLLNSSFSSFLLCLLSFFYSLSLCAYISDGDLTVFTQIDPLFLVLPFVELFKVFPSYVIIYNYIHYRFNLVV